VNGETHDALAYYQQQHPGGMPAVRHCRSCGAHIFWSYTRHGRRCPYDFDVATPSPTPGPGPSGPPFRNRGPLTPPCANCGTVAYTPADLATIWREVRCYRPGQWPAVTLCSFGCEARWAYRRSLAYTPPPPLTRSPAVPALSAGEEHA
jgi:hypothetical protein